MTIPITEVTIDGGPLPEGALTSYCYDPNTSAVYLSRLIDLPGTSVSSPVLTSPSLNSAGDSASLNLNAAVGGNGALVGMAQIFLADMGPNVLVTLSQSGAYNASVQLRPGLNIVQLNCQYSGSLLSTARINVTRTDDTEHTLQTVKFLYLDLPSEPGIKLSGTFTGFVAYATGTVDGSAAAWKNETVAVKMYELLPNTSWGYVTDNRKVLVTHTLAPFPPPFFDSEWFNPVDYVHDTLYQTYPALYGETFQASTSMSTIPSLSSVVRILGDMHAKPVPTAYSIALITEDADGNQLLWRCVSQQLNSNGHAYTVGRWTSSEKIYKYRAGGMLFGGRDRSGPLNVVLLDPQDGSTGTECRIIDLNEFRVNSDNEVEVDAYTCNYSLTDSKVYCVLDKTTGRMAEISYNTRAIKYFTLTVPEGSVIQQVFFTSRLMYTIYNENDGVYSLYDAHNNGVLLHTFDLGTYDPSVIPQFAIIN